MSRATRIFAAALTAGIRRILAAAYRRPRGAANTGTSLDSPIAPSTFRIESGSWIAGSTVLSPEADQASAIPGHTIMVAADRT